MITHKHTYGYSTNKKLVMGRGFVDSLSSIFNTVKSFALPALKSVGSYVKANRDLIAKPLLGAVGTIGAKAITEGLPAILSRIRNRNILNTNKNEVPLDINPNIMNDPKFKELFQNVMTPPSIDTPSSNDIPLTNIIGSGINKRKKIHRGKGIKKF